MNFVYFLIVLLFISIICIVFALGYIAAKISLNNGVLINKPISIFDKQTIKTHSTIDDTKFIVKINTNELQKKYNELGENKSSEESISNSVDKLKNMKK